MSEKIKVLIVDDSALVRQTLSDLLDGDDGIYIMATASDPFFAAEKIKVEVPDVIILDIEMPRMDGLTFLEKIMEQHPIPVIIFSSLTAGNSKESLKAMELGAVDVLAKPDLTKKHNVEEARIRICDSVKAATKASLKTMRRITENHPEPKLSADAMLKRSGGHNESVMTEHIIVVGASTGGTEAIRILLQDLPTDIPGIVIVQHMPEHFTASFAHRLNELSKINVKEAKNGDRVLKGQALVAPGNKHTMIKRNGDNYFVEVKDGPLVNRHRPSVDVLFRSAARYAGANAVGVILTGMGDDGSAGMLEMKEAGAYNIAQDEASSVVYGMPHSALKCGAVNETIELKHIADFLVERYAG